MARMDLRLLSRSAPQALAELCAEQTLALATPEEPAA
jgi:hypothetical protein